MKLYRMIFISFLLFAGVCHAAEFDMEVMQKAKRGVVSIKSSKNLSAYSNKGVFYGTGFVVSKELGIIVTNKHVVNSNGSASYEITFFNGTERDAKLMYYDPWHDFAFLKVDPKTFPEEVSQLEIQENNVNLNENIFILGKSEGQDFSIHFGRVSSIYESHGTLPNQTVRISLNIKGGASGSPVCNADGKVTALLYGGGDSYGLALHGNYLFDAINNFKNKKEPIRQHTGMYLEYYSLDKAAKFSKFPEEVVKSYIKKYPDSLNRALRISKFINDTPASKSGLKIGDIIWKLNGIEIGPNLYKLDKIMDDSNGNIKLEVYRDGKLVSVNVNLYDLRKTNIYRMLQFGGAVFYEPTDSLKHHVNVPSNEVLVTYVEPGSSFDVFPSVSNVDLVIGVRSINGNVIRNLDDLTKQIPQAIKQENFTIIYKNYSIYWGFNGVPIISEAEKIADIKYNTIDADPIMYHYNKDALEWDKKRILP